MENILANVDLRHSLLERLIHYYYFIDERKKSGNTEVTVTSTQIADLINMNDTLVRKDLAAIGVRGHPRVGFKAEEVLSAIRDVLGFDEKLRAIVIGAGGLGTALATYHGFPDYGLDICGLFDNDPQKTGWMIGKHIVFSMNSLAHVVEQNEVRIAVLTVPAEYAQEVADQVVEAGVEGIWNFASTSLEVPEHVSVRHEHISVGLAELSYLLKRKKRDDTE
jgi:redox-sensing transcriptional repressor